MTRRRAQQSTYHDASSQPDVMPARIRSTAFGITVRPKRDEESIINNNSSSIDHVVIKIVYTIIKTGLLINAVVTLIGLPA